MKRLLLTPAVYFSVPKCQRKSKKPSCFLSVFMLSLSHKAISDLKSRFLAAFRSSPLSEFLHLCWKRCRTFYIKLTENDILFQDCILTERRHIFPGSFKDLLILHGWIDIAVRYLIGASGKSFRWHPWDLHWFSKSVFFASDSATKKRSNLSTK